MVRARMRSGAEWSDVSIHNMSSRGLLASADIACPRGTVIEIRRIDHVIVGRVVWQKQGYFGVRTQDRIDIDGVVAARPPLQAPTREGDDRRTAPRPSRSIADRADRSRGFGRAFQFGVMIAVVGAAALVMASEIGRVLSHPFATVGAYLDGSAGHAAQQAVP